MDLRICLECGNIWDKHVNDHTYCYQCRMNNRLHTTNTADLGKVILKLRHENLLHHGKLK